YFTSSLFVDPLRRDISKLLQAFLDRVTTEAQKWDYLHLKVLEPRARRVFLETVMRLFL
ncbi:uncharacterized protein EI90DRAFT_2878748, partial [Cantharellus anzutake]|uniref:uncharacterized protein n=1 Tax=Cantharellus anzutake TaxID=1750568 RepID=UPI0019072A68